MKKLNAMLSIFDDRRQSFLHAIALCFIGLAVFAVYSNTFNSPFVLDDHIYIVENPKITDLSIFWPPSGTRYIAYLTFALNYSRNGLDVFGYHLVNTAVHFINSALVYLLVLALIKSMRIYPPHPNPLPQGAREFIIVPTLQRGNDERASLEKMLPLCTAFIFAVHPVQTEAVTYITQRFASLAASFYLLSIVLYLWWRNSRDKSALSEKQILRCAQNDNSEGLAAATGFFRGKALYAAALVSAVLAMKTKEISFTLPAVIAFLELSLSWKEYPEEGNTLRLRSWRLERIKRLLPFALTMLIIPLTLLLSSHGQGAGVAEKMARQQLIDLGGISKWSYLVTQFRVLVKYLRLIILPAGQNLLYEYPAFDSILVPEVFLSLIFLAIVFALLVYLYIGARRKNDVLMLLVSLGGFWFFVTISVESSIIPIQDTMFEHRLYLPMAGASLAFNSAAFKLAGAARRGFSIAAAIIVVAGIPLGVAAYKRNAVWRNTLAV